MASQNKRQTLPEIEAKERELKAELDTLKAQREQIEQQEVEAMIAIAGRVYVHEAKADEAKWQKLVSDMDAALKKKGERTLFGLAPLPRKSRNKTHPESLS